MTSFGGLGGIMGAHRDVNDEDSFELAIVKAFGEQMKSDNDLCQEIWSALANVDWVHSNGDDAGYSFRAAGDLIAAIRGEGSYIDWYCNGPLAMVSERISDAMLQLGWTWRVMS